MIIKLENSLGDVLSLSFKNIKPKEIDNQNRIENYSLDGTPYIQTIGKPTYMTSFTLRCNGSQTHKINLAYASAEKVKYTFQGVIYTCLIKQKPTFVREGPLKENEVDTIYLSNISLSILEENSL